MTLWRFEQEEKSMSKKKNRAMPPYYLRNVARNAQKAFFRRKASEANREKRQDKPEPVEQSGGKD